MKLQVLYKISFICFCLYLFEIFFGDHQLNISARKYDNDAALCKKDYQNCMLNQLMDSVFNTGTYKGVILIAENGKTIFRKGYGISDIDSSSFTPEIAMQLASISKPFTATAIMILEERNLLSYEDDLSKFFPDLNYKGVKIKHLLNHTSGIPDYINQNWHFKKFTHKKELVNNEDLLQHLIIYRPKQLFEAGKKHHYSNTGYALLASIIENVSKQPFTEFMQQNIFDVAGMKNTFFYSKDRTLRMKRSKEPLDGILGDKGIFSTVDDMLAFDQALYEDKIISQKTLKNAFKAQKTTKNEDFNYGYGWRIIENKDTGELTVYHRGHWQGFNPMFMRFVSCNRSIISLHLPTGLDVWKLSGQITNIINDSEKYCFTHF
ncbi:MAG: class A beta-lactamase-related serine hydrolase [Bacteroidetes bacterium]|nr:MAG: class A beta-lactamase-related serine hydrolase [Bacteroidota bacterium]